MTGPGELNRAALTQAAARRRQAWGLLLAAAIILIIVLLRAPAHLLFPAGWWRP